MTPETAKPNLRSRFARIWPFFGRSRSGWALAVVATVMAAATEPLVPALLKPLLDRGFQTGELDIWHVPALLMLLFTTRGLAGFLSQFALARVTNTGLEKLRSDMFDKVLSARFSLFADQSSSALANTVVYEVQNGSSLLITAVMRLSRDLLSVVALLGYLLFLNWQLTLVVGLMFPAVALVVRIMSRRLYRLTKQSQTATDDLAYVVEENVLAHRDIRLHGAQVQQGTRFNGLNRTLKNLSMKSAVSHAGVSALTQILAAVALSAVVTMAMMQSATDKTTVGGFVAFITAMLLLIAPLKSLSDAATPITRGLAALERGIDLLDLESDEETGSFTKDRAEGHIEISNVSVQYRSESKPALDEINLSIRAGETIALVGSSGSGKTTLINLLPRFVELSSGSITLDGVDLRHWDMASLRRQIAFVSQHVVMLNDSIAFNVALGQDIDRDKVRQCLEAANLGSLMTSLPLGMDTVLGHNATELSGGQRQRLAIARALYKNAPLILLDEATSALDTVSERLVQEALARLLGGRTTLIIAHRLSTIEHAHHVVVLNHGRVADIGTHAELVSRGGIYAHLQSMQNSG